MRGSFSARPPSKTYLPRPGILCVWFLLFNCYLSYSYVLYWCIHNVHLRRCLMCGNYSGKRLKFAINNAACCIFTWLVSYSLHSNYWSALKPSNHWVPPISRSIYNTLTTVANWIGSFRLMFNLVSIKRSNSTNALSKIQLSTLEIFLFQANFCSHYILVIR